MINSKIKKTLPVKLVFKAGLVACGLMALSTLSHADETITGNTKGRFSEQQTKLAQDASDLNALVGKLQNVVKLNKKLPLQLYMLPGYVNANATSATILSATLAIAEGNSNDALVGGEITKVCQSLGYVKDNPMRANLDKMKVNYLSGLTLETQKSLVEESFSVISSTLDDGIQTCSHIQNKE